MVEIEGASSEQRELLRNILDGMPGCRLERVIVAGAEPPYRRRPRDVVARVDYPRDRVRAHWEGMLVAGAFRDLSAAHGLPAVAVFAEPDAARAIGGDGVAIRLDLEPPHERDGVVLDALVRAAAGEELADLPVLMPYCYAAATRLRPKEPHGFLRYVLESYLQGTGHYTRLWEGSYVEVVDDGDDPIWSTGYSNRMSSGSARTRPDFACCDPFPRRSLFSPNPPPCPVFGERLG